MSCTRLRLRLRLRVVGETETDMARAVSAGGSARRLKNPCPVRVGFFVTVDSGQWLI